MKKRITNGWLALLLMVSVVSADMMPSLALTVQAGQEESAQQGMADGTSVTAETTGGEVEGTQEKQLVQYSNDWTILQYIDNLNKPMFDVRYLNKTVSELEVDNMVLQYRIIYQNEDLFKRNISSWYNLNYNIPEEIKSDIKANQTNYYIQFRIVTSDSTISESDTLLIWPQEEPFPYILSSTFNYFEVYNLNDQASRFIFNIKFSDSLSKVSSITGIEEKTSISRDLITGSYLRKVVSLKPSSVNVTINNKDYILNYTDACFELELPSTCLIKGTSTVNITYLLKLAGFEGTYTHKEPSQFMFTVCTPTAPDNTIYVEDISINAPSSTVKPGNKVALSATVAPSDATDKSVTWSSSNLAYATVDANGVVTTKAAGAGKSVVITATANDGSGVSGTYTLYIEKIPVTGITIKGSATSVTVGNKVNLSATVVPGDATNSGITWSSSNTAYATVDANGVVTTKAAGAGRSVVITATANDGSGVKSTFNINIKKVNVTKISLSTTTKTVKAGKKATVKAAIAPTNATNKAITWTSSNKKYATVSSKGVVTTKKAGIGKTVTITAKAKDGSGKKSSIKIKIVKTVKVSKIKLTASSKTVKAGKKVTVKATITPVNATNKALTWSSSNKKYAAVNEGGVVTTKKAGKGKTVTITAKAKDGSGKKAAVKIKIR